jgi:hypothetical protein
MNLKKTTDLGSRRKTKKNSKKTQKCKYGKYTAKSLREKEKTTEKARQRQVQKN